MTNQNEAAESHDDVIKWKHFPRHWPFVRGIHRSPVNSPHKGQWRGALMFSLICVWINGWVNNLWFETCDLRRLRPHYDVNIMVWTICVTFGTWYMSFFWLIDVEDEWRQIDYRSHGCWSFKLSTAALHVDIFVHRFQLVWKKYVNHNCDLLFALRSNMLRVNF